MHMIYIGKYVLARVIHDGISQIPMCLFFLPCFSPKSIFVLCFLQAGTGIAELIALEISRQVIHHFLFSFSATCRLCYTFDCLTTFTCADKSSYRGMSQENLAC